MEDQLHSLQVATQQVLNYYGLVSEHVPLAGDTIDIVTKIEPAIKVSATGTAGTWPTTLPSIVQFDNGLYAYLRDAASKQIIDPRTSQPSDASPYGNTVQWVTFTQITISEPLSPVQTVYIQNTTDNIDYKRLPTAPKLMYVNKPAGIDKFGFAGAIGNYRDFKAVPDTHKLYGAEVRIMGTAHHPIIPSGQDFWLDMDDWGNFTGTGLVANMRGYKLGDLSDTKPSTVTKLATTVTPIADIVRAPVSAMSTNLPDDPTYWHFRYLNNDHQPVRYKVMHAITITNYANPKQSVPLVRGQTIKIIGTFMYNHRTFLLPVMEDPSIPLFTYMLGIPETIDRVRVVEELPDFTTIAQDAQTTPIERVALKRAQPTDYVIHYATKAELAIERLFKRRNK